MSQSGKLNDLTPPPGTTLFLEGDVGGQVAPDGSGTIFVIGGDDVTTVGNLSPNTLTIFVDGTEATVQTTDATPTLIATVAIPSGLAIVINMSFVALENDLSTALGGNAFAVARNAGGGAQLSGGVHQSIIGNTPGIPQITVAANAGNVDIFVTGAAATVLNWRMFIKTLEST